MESIAGRINATYADGLLRCIFQIEVEKGFAKCRPTPDSVGNAEVQTLSRTLAAVMTLLNEDARQNTGLFVHWEFLYGIPLFNIKRLHGKGRVS